MQTENKISAKQVVFLIMTCMLTTVDVLLPNQIAQIAGRDAWVSTLAAPLIGLFIYHLLVALCLLFPDQSIAGINSKLLGKYLGGLLTLVYIGGFLLFCIIGSVEFSVIISTAFKPESPPYVWHLTVLIPALIVATWGIDVPARMNEFLLPIGLLLLVAVGILNISNIKLDEFLPIFQYGVMPSIEGAWLTGGRLTYSMLLFALVPVINKKHKLQGFGGPVFGVLGICLLIGVLSIPIIGLQATQAEIFPALMMVRAIDIGFLTRMDPFMMMIWYTGFFIFISVFAYATAVLTRDLFHLKSHGWVLWFYGIVILICANARIISVSQIIEMLEYPLTILLYSLSLVIPLLLYLVARLKGYTSS